MEQFINIFFYVAISFLGIFTIWTFMTFFVTRKRYRTTRILKGSDQDLESIRLQMNRPKKSIVLEGDTSAKSMDMLGKTFDKIKDGMISNSLKNEELKNVTNIDNKEDSSKED
jgi:hypothetical protein